MLVAVYRLIAIMYCWCCMRKRCLTTVLQCLCCARHEIRRLHLVVRLQKLLLHDGGNLLYSACNKFWCLLWEKTHQPHYACGMLYKIGTLAAGMYAVPWMLQRAHHVLRICLALARTRPRLAAVVRVLAPCAFWCPCVPVCCRAQWQKHPHAYLACERPFCAPRHQRRRPVSQTGVHESILPRSTFPHGVQGRPRAGTLAPAVPLASLNETGLRPLCGVVLQGMAWHSRRNQHWLRKQQAHWETPGIQVRAHHSQPHCVLV